MTSNRDLKSLTTWELLWDLIFAKKEYLDIGLSNSENLHLET